MLENTSPQQELLYATIVLMDIAAEREHVLVLIVLRFQMPMFINMQSAASF